jgi:REase_DpnII-MboI
VGDAAQIGEVIGGLAELAGASRVVAPASTAGVAEVHAALQEFNECVRYLNTRRSSGAVLRLDSEAAVQDALFLMLRPWIHDLTPEAPSDKTGNRFSLCDFASRSLRLVIEAKFVRDRPHGRSISKELYDDIEVYRQDAHCDHILFFIYDPDSNIPDERELRRTIEQRRVYDDRALICTLIVKP